MLEVTLNITPDMRDCKTKFWKALESNPICDPDHVTLAAAEQLTKEKKLKGWWAKPAFVQWFSDEGEYETKLTAVKFTAVDALYDIIANPDSPASARVAACKLIMDHAKIADKDTSAIEEALKKVTGITDIKTLEKLAE